MFNEKIYRQRRERLRKQIKSGIALFIGNEESPMNYPSNPYHFRQDSSFLYFFGLDSSSLVGIVDADEGKDFIFGDDISVEDIIWMGEMPSLKERALQVGIKHTAPLKNLTAVINKALKGRKKIHYCPPYRSEAVLKISKLLGIHPEMVKDYSSEELIKAVVEQRSVKIPEEIEEMEKAHEVTHEMYLAAMKMAKPGTYERELAGQMEGICMAAGCYLAFPTILTINGQILHNHYHGNRLQKGRLLVVDSGAESSMHYASDITRTFPVGGKFTKKQKDIYSIVLSAQEEAIRAIKTGIPYKDVHLIAVRIITQGLKDLGLIKGNPEDAARAGAHALFFPHGLGHMIGLDVHDMENLGEDYVGYNHTVKRSEQFGLAYLRLAKKLQPYYVVTVEPGIYFIPALIDKWIAEKKFQEFIDYDRVNQYRDFGGVRIEDDVLVTETGYKILGKSIPKAISDVEDSTAKA
ncbi:MAG: aminopeptidase P family protein [Acidobacteriota bacterium]|nr:aminopeptidase P family protein [Acidobacteriota bacterium]